LKEATVFGFAILVAFFVLIGMPDDVVAPLFSFFLLRLVVAW